jgi:hypothetical protein
MTEMPLRPDEADISTDGEDVVLDFRSDAGESRSIVLSRQWLPGLIARLMHQVGPDEAIPSATDQGSLQVGARFAVQGWQVARQSDGARRLDVIINLPDQDRVVTIPLDLTPPDVQSLIDQLK